MVTELRIPLALAVGVSNDIGYKQKSNGEQSSTTIRLVFDEGWTIDMRLHSGDSKIKPTGLKFAVSLGGNPNGLYQQQIAWDEVI